MIVIDPGGPDAKIHFEPFSYVPVEGKTPVFVIEKEKQRQVFDDLLESFNIAYK